MTANWAYRMQTSWIPRKSTRFARAIWRLKAAICLPYYEFPGKAQPWGEEVSRIGLATRALPLPNFPNPFRNGILQGGQKFSEGVARVPSKIHATFPPQYLVFLINFLRETNGLLPIHSELIRAPRVRLLQDRQHNCRGAVARGNRSFANLLFH